MKFHITYLFVQEDVNDWIPTTRAIKEKENLIQIILEASYNKQILKLSSLFIGFILKYTFWLKEVQVQPMHQKRNYGEPI